jgi:hypothetical protein
MERHVKKISEIRFNALAGYARAPRARLIGEELAYFETVSGDLLGLLVRDRSDGDFSGMAFGRDRKLCFRWTSMTDFFETSEQALSALDKLLTDLADHPEEFHHQGDEVGEPVDFFAAVHPVERLNHDFMEVMSEHAFSPARGVIDPMMRWHKDLDGNFVEQFQSTAFDQRIWELYLFAMMTEIGYELDSRNAIPDFIGQSVFGKIAIEAVTVGPTRNGAEIVPAPPIDTDEQMEEYLQNYMPIKFGSPLFSKLQKRYWDKPQIAGLPLVFAIADFSSPGSMLYTRPALERYLYGFSYEAVSGDDGKTTAQAKRIVEHRWGAKVIASGFFSLPEAKHISAVISNPAGTISKFNRMGLLAGYGSDDILIKRTGTCLVQEDHAVKQLYFEAIINAEGYHESWIEGLNVYHNPHAETFLPEHFMPGAAHHHCDDQGNWSSRAPNFQPLESETEILTGVDVDKILAENGATAMRFYKDEGE